MSLHHKQLVVCALIIFAITACNTNDEPSPDLSNSIFYDGNEYYLESGVLLHKGLSEKECYKIDLTLVSPGLTIHAVDGELAGMSGFGHSMHFKLFAASNDKLPLGVYRFDINQTQDTNTFDYGSILLNYTPETGIGTELSFSSGSIEVSANNPKYELTINCITNEGKTLTAYYSGFLSDYF